MIRRKAGALRYERRERLSYLRCRAGFVAAQIMTCTIHRYQLCL